jgi:hypothetical protein
MPQHGAIVQELRLLSKDRSPIASATGLLLTPTTTFRDCPALDVLCVPGDAGINAPQACRLRGKFTYVSIVDLFATIGKPYPPVSHAVMGVSGC